MSNESSELLADFVTRGSEAAFHELVGRYVDFVYSTALRIVSGNTGLAEDITQTVFLSLARKASGLSRSVMLGGWLHQHTYYVATRALRSEMRRQAREREAFEMNRLSDDSEAPWREIAPLLDDAITELKSEDRTAILLRFFEQRDFRAVGQALGSTEDAARVRVNRALEKLHVLLRRRGVTLSAGTLGTVLTAEVVQAAPAGLALAISNSVIAAAGAGAAGAGITFTILKIMATTQMKVGVTALILAGAATTALLERRGKLAAENENESLRRQVAELQQKQAMQPPSANPAVSIARLPAPAIGAGNSSATESTLPLGDLYSFMTNRSTMVKLTPTQVEAYLKQNGRSAVSLLAAFRTSDNAALLREALQSYPDDPQVNFEAAVSKEGSPAEHRQWLEAFKKSAPDNSLAYYLSAANYFKAGQPNEALQELLAASSKTEFRDYTIERNQADQEAFRTAGYSVAQASVLATKQQALPQLVQASDLSGSLLDLAKSYREAGDTRSAQAALGMAADLGRRYSEPSSGQSVLAQLFGIAVESKALATMDPASTYPQTGQTVQERRDQLGQQKASVRELIKQADSIFPSLSDQDWISYGTRSASLGEEAAIRWLVDKFATK